MPSLFVELAGKLLLWLRDVCTMLNCLLEENSRMRRRGVEGQEGVHFVVSEPDVWIS